MTTVAIRHTDLLVGDASCNTAGIRAFRRRRAADEANCCQQDEQHESMQPLSYHCARICHGA